MMDDSSDHHVAYDHSEAVALHSFAEGSLAIRRWERNFVPFSSPQIALDIALYATASKLKNRFVSSKSVHLTVGHSADRVREVLTELISGGWIAKTQHPHDKRIRLIEATDRLIALMLEYEKCTRTRLGECTCGLPSRASGRRIHLQAG